MKLPIKWQSVDLKDEIKGIPLGQNIALNNKNSEKFIKLCIENGGNLIQKLSFQGTKKRILLWDNTPEISDYDNNDSWWSDIELNLNSDDLPKHLYAVSLMRNKYPNLYKQN